MIETMSKPTKSNAKKRKMLAALRKHWGVVTPAAEEAGIARTTHYEWLKEDPTYAKAVDELEDVALDLTESALHTNIKAGDTTAIIFHLKCRGKKRGYVERSEHIVATGDNLARQLTPEQAMEILATAGYQPQAPNPDLSAD